MSEFTDRLKTLNRKERYYLLRWALGSFDLCQEFRENLSSIVGLTIPANAYVAMDYHLNWIYASIVLSLRGPAGTVYPNFGVVQGDRETGIIRGNQEDIDLIIAFEDEQMDHLIMVEAKGVTPWSPAQLRHKADRLRSIFSEDFCKVVCPHFVVASPHPVPAISPKDPFDWPNWMVRPDRLFRWVAMPIDGELQAVTRSNEKGKASAAGQFWTLKRGDAPGHPRAATPDQNA